MAAKPITLIIRPRGKPIKNLPDESTFTLLDSTAELYKKIAGSSGCSVHRLRITKGSDSSVVPNSRDVSIDRTGLRDRSTVIVKDLGPQIAWRTVFVVEYLGPLLIHPLVYYARPYIYPLPSVSASKIPAPSNLQYLTLVLVSLHFLKRELETLFVHRFSSATMPARNIFKNSFHYWIISGLNIAYWTYSPSSPSATDSAPYASILTPLGIALFTVGELLNLSAHVTLRNLRSDEDPTKRGIPQGWDFNVVTCPNYLWETLAWTGIMMVSRSWSTGIFIVIAVAQMAAWAKKKERRYRSEFGQGYRKKRFAMLPGLV